MADWKAQYLTALQVRDSLEKADLDLYDRCTLLADRNAKLKAEIRKLNSNKPEPSSAVPVPAPLIGYGFRRQASPQTIPGSDNITQLRQDFAKSQQDRADLRSQLETTKKEVEILTAKANIDSKNLTRLSSNVTLLTTKIKDREEELRGKAKLLVNVQDENATLNLELHQADEEVKRIKKENKDLVDRWVVRMGKEADKMNEDSKFT